MISNYYKLTAASIKLFLDFLLQYAGYIFQGTFLTPIYLFTQPSTLHHLFIRYLTQHHLFTSFNTHLGVESQELVFVRGAAGRGR